MFQGNWHLTMGEARVADDRQRADCECHSLEAVSEAGLHLKVARRMRSCPGIVALAFFFCAEDLGWPNILPQQGRVSCNFSGTSYGL